EATLRDYTRRLLGDEALDASAPLALRVDVEGDEHALRGTLVVDGGATRELRAETCGALLQDLALALARVPTQVDAPVRERPQAVERESPPARRRWLPIAPETPPAAPDGASGSGLAFIAGGVVDTERARAVLLGARVRRDARSLAAELALH